jgi:hypothetical protein
MGYGAQVLNDLHDSLLFGAQRVGAQEHAQTALD